ncbi:3-oxoacyl-ACP reductase [Bacteroidia bacterium]|nr:3-oxoacyl-ACP reductase [Bacteroidia bacterium]
MNHPFSLTGKVALITGGGTGLGFGIAQSFVANGAKIVIVGRREDVLQQAVEALGENCRYIVADLQNHAQLPGLWQRAETIFGSIDILVNNAGNHLKKMAEEVTDEEFMSILNLHVLSVFALTREAIKSMKVRGGGSVLFLSSMTAIMGQGKVVAYSTAKTGILGMMRNLVVEYAQDNIRFNAIAPGWIESPMLHKAIDNDLPRKNRILQRIPSGQFGQPEDIGNAAVYLSSDAAKYVSGVLLPVDFGASISF